MKSCFQRAFINGLVGVPLAPTLSAAHRVTTTGSWRSWKHIKRTVKISKQSVGLAAKKRATIGKWATSNVLHFVRRSDGVNQKSFTSSAGLTEQTKIVSSHPPSWWIKLEVVQLVLRADGANQNSFILSAGLMEQTKSSSFRQPGRRGKLKVIYLFDWVDRANPKRFILSTKSTKRTSRHFIRESVQLSIK